MNKPSPGLQAVWSKSAGGVGYPELQQIRSEVNIGLFCLAMVALLWRQPWFAHAIAKMLHQFILVWVADRWWTTASTCGCGGGLVRKDAFSHTPMGREVSLLKVKHISTDEWKGAWGICCFILANLNAYETSCLIGSYLERHLVGAKGL